MPSPLTYDDIVRQLRRRTYAVLSTVDEHGFPHAAGVDYGVSLFGDAIYVMTRRHLKKARNIAANPHVALTIPLMRRILWFLPPPSIQFQATAEILDRTDEGGVETFRTFFLGRQILKMYDDFVRRGETRVCFLRITPSTEISTYMVGQSIWRTIRRMESGVVKVRVPAASSKPHPSS